MDTQFGRTLVTGGNGFLGKHLCRKLDGLADDPVWVALSSQHDLRNQEDVSKLFDQWGPFDTVFHLAARVGGISPTSQQPAQFFYDNAAMGLNVIHASHLHKVTRTIVVGSVCAYPLHAPLPMNESDLWNGKPEPSNASYGYAKRFLLPMLESYNEQYGMRSAYVLLSNLYGPGDDFSEHGHVIPMLIRKMIENPSHLDVWGSGNASRDFLYVEDAADALIEIAQQANRPLPTNVGSGKEVTIRDLVCLLGDLLNYQGTVSYDTNKPDGQPRRMLDLGRVKAITKWEPKMYLVDGLQKAIDYYREKRYD